MKGKVLNMNYDINVNGNLISGRQGFAYVCNSGKFQVLIADVDMPQEYKGYNRFGKVGVVWSYAGKELTQICTLECNEGQWELGCGGTCLKGDFGFGDMVESIENANISKVRRGDIVAVALKSQNTRFVLLNMLMVEDVNIHCQTVAKLRPLDDAEMEALKQDALKWLR